MALKEAPLKPEARPDWLLPHAADEELYAVMVDPDQRYSIITEPQWQLFQQAHSIKSDHHPLCCGNAGLCLPLLLTLLCGALRSLYKTLLIPKPTPTQLAEAAEQNDGNFGEPGDFGTKPIGHILLLVGVLVLGSRQDER